MNGRIPPLYGRELPRGFEACLRGPRPAAEETPETSWREFGRATAGLLFWTALGIGLLVVALATVAVWLPGLTLILGGL
jgi:hypothetical protein